jgi:hypothetical protein
MGPGLRRDDGEVKPSPADRVECAPAVHGKRRCRMHGGAQGSGAPKANQNARKHGLFTRDAIEERREICVLLGDARKLLEEMK